ncbi:MAG: succinate dehydrogenase, hydrophobic membrane anchor protein [Sedimenticola sp.]|jgi:succinate dehydrogenase / fumarate reductase membrane anchor subunit|nr:MAG: succinate dehydrogenase, hydrophobic membrane anchor protein [Sedimenticola sp.]
MSRQASGLRAWVLQRISAAYIGLYIIYATGHFIINPPQSHADWKAWVADPLVAFALSLFFALLLVHAWVGIRDVLIDYVKPIMARVALLTLFGLGFLGCGLWAAKVIFLAAMPS